MSVVSGLAVSVDGYVTGPDPSPEQALGRGGQRLFDWYFVGDVPSQVFEGFRLSEPSQKFFDALSGRLGAVICGRTTYDHSSGFGGGSPHPTAALVVLTHRPVPEASEHQTVAHGIEEAVARAVAGAGRRRRGARRHPPDLPGGQLTAMLIGMRIRSRLRPSQYLTRVA